jgi:hypothetical protein
MNATRQKKIRAVLRANPNGLSSQEIGQMLKMDPPNIRASLKAMPDVYTDRWRMGGRGQYEKVWIAVPVPEDCPHPKDRIKWGNSSNKPKTQWVMAA